MKEGIADYGVMHVVLGVALPCACRTPRWAGASAVRAAILYCRLRGRPLDTRLPFKEHSGE